MRTYRCFVFSFHFESLSVLGLVAPITDQPHAIIGLALPHIPRTGIDITDEQISQMEANIMNIDFEKAEKKETETRHDVMAHVYTYGEVCPAAQGIIHMGATSCFVGDNTDIVQLKEGMELLRRKLVKLLAQMKAFAGTCERTVQ